MSASHKTECMSYARHRAEEQRPNLGDPGIETRAVELLSTGDVTCICGDLPS